MKKIIVDKNEGIADVIDRMLNEPDKDISLVIPKGSEIGRSVSNFHLLKREADSAGRNVVVESVDDTILAFAKESDLDASHPLWKGVRGAGGFSDIVPRKERATVVEDSGIGSDNEDEDEDEREEPKKLIVKHEKPSFAANRRSLKAESLRGDDDEEDEEEDPDEAMLDAEAEEEDEKMEKSGRRFFGSRSYNDDDDRSSSSGRGKKIGTIVAIIIVCALIVAYILSVFFNRADITINFKQDPWSYQNSFTAETSATTSDPATNVIGAQVFTDNKNITDTFKASSEANVSLKAQGTITIYNAYSAKPQELVATTRFLTPSGLVFRIVNNVTVPGEQTQNGNLVPSSISVPIVADQPGPSYNIGPVDKLTIPGFANDPGLEAGFYGVITASTTGGFTGEKAVPTAADVSAAEASTTADLQSALQGGFSGTYPNNFKILDGAVNTQVTKVTVNTSTDSNGNFSVYGQATLQAIGFDEGALKTYLLSQAQAQENNSVFKSLNLTYSDVSADFKAGTLAFTVSAQAALEPSFDVNQFASSIAGKSISDARSTISQLPQLDSGQISVWPSWLWDIPSNTSKIHVTVN